jgi:hypothetical protein
MRMQIGNIISRIETLKKQAELIRDERYAMHYTNLVNNASKLAVRLTSEVAFNIIRVKPDYAGVLQEIVSIEDILSLLVEIRAAVIDRGFALHNVSQELNQDRADGRF